ncbi:uncharacterized protein [Typha latifolia]|uniref:uncharacterized protein isoform X2 n=1 Tax=Typha latifolia TaxID=4733 RepID=UPI003C2F287C
MFSTHERPSDCENSQEFAVQALSMNKFGDTHPWVQLVDGGDPLPSVEGEGSEDGNKQMRLSDCTARQLMNFMEVAGATMLLHLCKALVGTLISLGITNCLPRQHSGAPLAKAEPDAPS